MTPMLLIGLGAGLSSGFLVAALTPGTVVARVLFCLAPLPLILAGLGWGWPSAVLAALVGTAVVSVALAPEFGLLYALACAAPAAWFTQLALLSRPAEGGKVEWYPPGVLLTRIAWFACAFTVAVAVLYGPDADTFRANVIAPFGEWLVGEIEHEFEEPEQAAAFAHRAAERLVPGSPSAWLIIMAVNLWAAGRAMKLSGRLARPWPNLGRIVIPRNHVAALAASILLGFMPGALGLIGFALTQVWVTAFLLAGLAVIHAATAGLQGRVAILAVLYLVIVFANVVALGVVLVGVLEPFFNIRARILRRRNVAPGPD